LLINGLKAMPPEDGNSFSCRSIIFFAILSDGEVQHRVIPIILGNTTTHCYTTAFSKFQIQLLYIYSRGAESIQNFECFCISARWTS
jgi:hypothetical protein